MTDSTKLTMAPRRRFMRRITDPYIASQRYSKNRLSFESPAKNVTENENVQTAGNSTQEDLSKLLELMSQAQISLVTTESQQNSSISQLATESNGVKTETKTIKT